MKSLEEICEECSQTYSDCTCIICPDCNQNRWTECFCQEAEMYGEDENESEYWESYN